MFNYKNKYPDVFCKMPKANFSLVLKSWTCSDTYPKAHYQKCSEVSKKLFKKRIRELRLLIDIINMSEAAT